MLFVILPLLRNDLLKKFHSLRKTIIGHCYAAIDALAYAILGTVSGLLEEEQLGSMLSWNNRNEPISEYRCIGFPTDYA